MAQHPDSATNLFFVKIEIYIAGIMRILLSRYGGILADVDIERIAMEMVNVYQGIESYDPIEGKRLATPRTGMLTFRSGDNEYEIVPTFGQIIIVGAYINNKKYVNQYLIKDLADKIQRVFLRLNGDYHRPVAFDTRELGVLSVKTDETKRQPISIIMNNKAALGRFNGGTHMIWQMSQSNVCQFAVPGLSHEPDETCLSSAATVVLDLSHTYRASTPYSLSWPALPVAKILKTGMDLPAARMNVEYRVQKINCENDKIPIDDIINQFKYYTSIQMIDGGLRDVDRCSRCRTVIWGEYYHHDRVDICRFCAHHDKSTINSFTRTTIIYKSQKSAASVLTSIENPEMRTIMAYLADHDFEKIGDTYICGPYLWQAYKCDAYYEFKIANRAGPFTMLVF